MTEHKTKTGLMSLVALEREHSDGMFLEWARRPPPLVDANGELQLVALWLVGSYGCGVVREDIDFTISVPTLHVPRPEDVPNQAPMPATDPEPEPKLTTDPVPEPTPTSSVDPSAPPWPIAPLTPPWSLGSARVLQPSGSILVRHHSGFVSALLPFNELYLHLCPSL